MRTSILNALRGKRSAEEVATALYRVLRAQAEALGQDPDREVLIRRPGEPRHFDDTACWVVAWEAGPFQWAYDGSHAVMDATGRLCEPYYSFDLCLYENA